MNTFMHISIFPSVLFRDVARPNFDTLYFIAWLDLTKELLIISAPETVGRYYLLPMLDLWTVVFANSGKRSTGTKEGTLSIAANLHCMPADTRRVR